MQISRSRNPSDYDIKIQNLKDQSNIEESQRYVFVAPDRAKFDIENYAGVNEIEVEFLSLVEIIINIFA